MTDWRECQLGDLGVVVGGGTPPRERAEYWNGSIPWLTPGELTGHSDKFVFETQDCISELGLASSGARLLSEGSLLVTSRASIGSCALAGRPMATNQGFKNVTPGTEVDPSFLFYLGRTLAKEMTRRAAGTTFLEITGREFERIKVRLPPLEEQRRIAEILDTIDDVIKASGRVAAKLTRIEHGLKRDLVVNQASTSEEWTPTAIGDLGSVVTGGTPPTDDDRLWGGTIPFITPGDIDLRGEIRSTKRHVTELGASRLRKVPRGSIAVVCIGSTVGKVGRIQTTSVTNQQINTVVPSDAHDSEFLACTIELLRDDLEAAAGRQALPIINASVLRSTKVNLCSLNLQRKIAEHLAALRNRIKFELSQLEKLRHVRNRLAADLLSGTVRTEAT